MDVGEKGLWLMTLTMGLRRSLVLGADAEALVSDEARLTRRDLVDRVARLAAAPLDLGMQAGDRVAISQLNLPSRQSSIRC